MNEYTPYNELHLFFDPFNRCDISPKKHGQWILRLTLAGAYRKEPCGSNGSGIALDTTFPPDETKEELFYYAERIQEALKGAPLVCTIEEDYKEWAGEAAATKYWNEKEIQK